MKEDRAETGQARVMGLKEVEMEVGEKAKYRCHGAVELRCGCRNGYLGGSGWKRWILEIYEWVRGVLWLAIGWGWISRRF